MMKRIIPFLLLCIYLSGSGLLYYGFRVTQYVNYIHVRERIKNNILKSEIKLLVIKKEDFPSVHWKRNRKEFEFHGQLYDIARTSIRNRTYYIYCYPDINESRITAAYKHQKAGCQSSLS
jgi:hypothetical protein